MRIRRSFQLSETRANSLVLSSCCSALSSKLIASSSSESESNTLSGTVLQCWAVRHQTIPEGADLCERVPPHFNGCAGELVINGVLHHCQFQSDCSGSDTHRCRCGLEWYDPKFTGTRVAMYYELTILAVIAALFGYWQHSIPAGIMVLLVGIVTWPKWTRD